MPEFNHGGTEARRGERIIVVAGFPRSGSSLTMQMLSAAGVPCLGEYPAFEDENVCSMEDIDAAALMPHKGKAVKVLEPHINRLPKGFLYDFILLSRNPREQAKSTVKFMAAIGIPLAPHATRGFEQGYRKDFPKVVRELESHEGCRILRLSFEDLVEKPLFASEMIANFIGGLDVAVMAKVALPRGAACLPGMLECVLMEREEVQG